MSATYFTRAQGVVRGPFSFLQLQTMKARGQLQRFHEVSADRAIWVSAGSIVELFGVAAVEAQAPAPPADTVIELPGAAPVRMAHPVKRRRVPVGWIVGSLASLLVLAAGGYFLFLWLENRDRASAVPVAEMSAKAIALLKQHCHECHGKDPGNMNGANKQFDVLNRDALVHETAGRPRAKKYLVPGDPAASALWNRIEDDSMPDGADKLTAADKRLLKAWIVAGASFPTGQEELPVSTGGDVNLFDVLEMIFNDLTKAPPEQRSQRRYFAFHHLHNNRDVTREVRQNHHAALSKLLNSLSKNPTIVVPKALDANRTVFRIELTDYHWNARQWSDLLAGTESSAGSFVPNGTRPALGGAPAGRGDRLNGMDMAGDSPTPRHYPYGLREIFPDGKVDAQDKLSFIQQMTGSPMPVVRGDWFIAHASKPPLYHTLLGIPERLDDLDRTLNVARLANIRSLNVKRAGFLKSGVSYANRMIERHEIRAGYAGYYWISYDFKPDNRRASLTEFPLGPKEANISPPDLDLAFDADGGELIFALPNGLQGYMLIKADGTRINDGPTDVVKDSKDSAHEGNKIFNGLSCFGCHEQGMIPKYDDVRNGSKGIRADALPTVKSLYRTDQEMKREFDADQAQYLSALKKCYEGLGGHPKKEPIVACHQEYYRGINLKKAAAELGIKEDRLESKCKYDAVIAAKFGVLANKGGVIDRKRWEREFGATALDLQIGRPLTRLDMR